MDDAAGMKKPIATFIACAASPPGKKIGHAGAIVMSDKAADAGKKATLEAAGVQVVPMPSHVAMVLAKRLVQIKP